jgi:hypothetical protein
MAEAIIKPGHFAVGPSPYVSAYQQGQKHATQVGQFQEEAQLRRQALAIKQRQEELKLQEQWKMLQTQLAQEREIEGERTKRHQATEKRRRAEHKETVGAMQQKQLSPEERLIEALTKELSKPPGISPLTGQPTEMPRDPFILELYKMLLSGMKVPEAFKALQKMAESRRLQELSMQQPAELALQGIGPGGPVAPPGQQRNVSQQLIDALGGM